MSPETRKRVVSMIKDAVDQGLCVKKATSLVGISDSTYYIWKDEPELVDKRTKPHRTKREGVVTNPQTKMAIPQEVREKIIAQLRDPQMAHLSPRHIQIWSTINSGVHLASVRTYQRIAKEIGRTFKKSHKRSGGMVNPDGKIVVRRRSCRADRPNQVYMWDISYLKNQNGKKVYLFLVEDLYSRKIVGSEFFDSQTAENAVKFFKRILEENGITKAHKLVVHSDNGPAMRSLPLIKLFAEYGIQLSLSRPHISNDNPFIESLFRTLKHAYGCNVRHVITVDECNKVLAKIVHSYNYERPHSSIGYVTPGIRHEGIDKENEFLNTLKKAQEAHFIAHKNRYIGKKMRKYERVGAQFLNPDLGVRVINGIEEVPASGFLSRWASLMLKNGSLVMATHKPSDKNSDFAPL